MDSTSTDIDDVSLAKNRSRRAKTDKNGRLAALEKLRKTKETGQKNKYEIKEEQNIYEEVDEDEYSRIVRNRQDDDWIVDDDGCGYVEDGRDIFDDDLGEETPSSKAKKKDEKKSKNPNIRAPDSKPADIKSMWAAAAVKSKRPRDADVSLKDDNLLGDLLAEIREETSNIIAPAPLKMRKKVPESNFHYDSSPVSAARAPKFMSKLSNDDNNRTDNGFNENKFSDVKSKPVTKTNKMPDVAKSHTVLSERQLYDTKVMPLNNVKTVSNGPKMEAKKHLPDKSIEEDFSQAIDSYNTQDVSHEPPSQQIDDSEFNQDAGDMMDVSGVDFDEDMEEEAQPVVSNRPVAEVAKKNSFMSFEADPVVHSADVCIDPANLPVTINEKGEQVLSMFWLDAYEDPSSKPGTVYLFGKVWIEKSKTYVSCCLAVKNIARKLYLLPRRTRLNKKTGEDSGEEVTVADIYQEFDSIATEKYKVMKFRSRPVVKQYAFDEENVPAEAEYLEVLWPADFPSVPADLSGETFSRVFGTRTSYLELLLLDRKLKGPSWLEIRRPRVPNPSISWCKLEVSIDDADLLSVAMNQTSVPPLVLMSLNLVTMTSQQSHQNEIVIASVLVHHSFHVDRPAPKPLFNEHFCAITKPSDGIFPFDFKDQVKKKGNSMKVEIMDTERALLGFLLAKIHKLDPDIIVGQDIYRFDLDVLLHRINQRKIPQWSRLGRLKRSQPPRLPVGGGAKNSAVASAACGRLVCDIQVSAKELIRCRSYDLNELVSVVLKEKREEINSELVGSYFNKSVDLLYLMESSLVDCTFILRIMHELSVVPLALQLTNIAGNTMTRTLLGGRSERNEFLLLHAFTEKSFLVPDKQYGKKQIQEPADVDDDDDDNAKTHGKKSGRRKPAYAGGLVLEPKKGFYDKYILLLDFNSLYPSIIQEYNICFTTVSRPAPVAKKSAEGDEDIDDSEPLAELPDKSLPPGILPTEIRKLVESRRQVKALMKAPDLTSEQQLQYDIRQKALKLTANSMYGCLGFSNSRFYAKPLAALVTAQGREILMKTKELVEGQLNLEVIYGDTDSIMVATNCTDLDQVTKIGSKIKAEVNKLYRLLEIEMDGIFRSMLLLKKKKYAALTVQKNGDKVTYTEELKGLDIVRRDWCELAKDIGKYVVSQILSGDSREDILERIHNKLSEESDRVRNGSVPVEKFQIAKQLTKPPEMYTDKKSQPHVQVALRLNGKGGKKLSAGDTVFYVICNDGTREAATQRAYSPDELSKQPELSLDVNYYLAHQVHPVVSRLCNPLDGTDAARIAECLGLDPSGYRHATQAQERAEDEAMLAGDKLSDVEKFARCERFTFHCPSCRHENVIDGVFIPNSDPKSKVRVLQLAKCGNTSCSNPNFEICKNKLMNLLTMAIHKHISTYYKGFMKCDDPMCGERTRRVPLKFSHGQPLCPKCYSGTLHLEYSDADLYLQLTYYQHIFDFGKTIKGLNQPFSQNLKATYQALKNHVDHYLRHSAYSEINLDELFSDFFTLK